MTYHDRFFSRAISRGALVLLTLSPLSPLLASSASAAAPNAPGATRTTNRTITGGALVVTVTGENDPKKSDTTAQQQQSQGSVNASPATPNGSSSAQP